MYQFNETKYTKWYYSIINHAKSQNRIKLTKDNPNYIYFENHHIIPKSICKELSNSKDNKVLLTAKEHFICHCLLTKMIDNQDKYKMYSALKMMIGTKTDKRFTSRLYQILRKKLKLSEDHKRRIGISAVGRKHSEETKIKMSRNMKGIPKTEDHKKKLRKPKSEETKMKMSLSHKGKESPKKGLPGKKHSEESKIKMSQKKLGINNHFHGKEHTESTKLKMKETRAKNRERNKTKCEYCEKLVYNSMYVRWHGSKCKQNHSLLKFFIAE